MKRTLIVLRHAKPESYSVGRNDQSRKLTEGGIAQVADLANRLTKEGISCQKIITSDALRANETAQGIAKVLGKTPEVNSKLYSASLSQVEAIVSRLEDDVLSVMIVGHNPTFSELSMKLTREPIMLDPCQCLIVEAELEHWANFDSAPWEIKHNIKV